MLVIYVFQLFDFNVSVCCRKIVERTGYKTTLLYQCYVDEMKSFGKLYKLVAEKLHGKGVSWSEQNV
jgi:hypothetical protein